MNEPIITVKGLRRALAESDAETAALLVDAGVLHALVREYENAVDRANDAVAYRYYAEHVIDRLTLDLNRALNGEHPLQKKDGRTVYVNGREVEIGDRSLSYDALVALAFPTKPTLPAGVVLTVVYHAGEHKASGALIAGQSVKIAPGMRFNIARTDNA